MEIAERSTILIPGTNFLSGFLKLKKAHEKKKKRKTGTWKLNTPSDEIETQLYILGPPPFLFKRR